MIQCSFQLVRGLWNPAGESYSWVVGEEFGTIKEARDGLDTYIAQSLGLPWGDALTNEQRESYSGPPVALLRVQTKLLDRFGAEVAIGPMLKAGAD